MITVKERVFLIVKCQQATCTSFSSITRKNRLRLTQEFNLDILLFVLLRGLYEEESNTNCVLLLVVTDRLPSAQRIGSGQLPTDCPQSVQTFVNPLKPNDAYRRRTAPLTSKRCILYIFIQQIQVLNILNIVCTLVFSSSKCSLFHNSNVFDSCIIHILYIYSTNIGTEYFKHSIHSRFFFFRMQFVS